MPGTGFDEFVDERLDDLLRFASVLTCDADRAQQVVQEALLRARPRWRRIARTGEPTAEVRRMITDQYLSSPGEAAAESDDGDVLARIAALPPRQRAALALRYHADQADIEIAAVLDCSASAVRGLLAQAVATVQGAPAVVAAKEAS